MELARETAAEAQLRRLLAPGATAKIQAASTGPHARGAQCLVHVEGFCLQSQGCPLRAGLAGLGD